MAETKVNGYLVNVNDYQIFDGIITILTNNGQKMDFLAKGIKKINSKNARNLIVGNYCECLVFLARQDGKVSRLKKIIALKSVSWELSKIESFNVLNELSQHFNEPNKQNFYFYKQMLDLIQNNHDLHDQIKTIIIIKHYFDISGFKLHVNSCVVCNNKKLKTISLQKLGMLCPLCFHPKKDHLFPIIISKIFYWIWNENFQKLSNHQDQLNFVLKLLKGLLENQLGIKLKSLNHY